MAHLTFNNEGTLGTISASVSTGTGLHVFSLTNASESAATLTVVAGNATTTINPDYEAGGSNIGGNKVLSNEGNTMRVRLNGKDTMLFEINATTAGNFTVTGDTTHKTSAANAQRVWLAQV